MWDMMSAEGWYIVRICKVRPIKCIEGYHSAKEYPGTERESKGGEDRFKNGTREFVVG
jgi:hypothetical protein